ncbi:methyltransferase-domain-containing protein [Multifurca ochricompacta]|uniref:Ribosomal RNA-processing protein 8 n=1 Tax=Multifurca ochricompacta TaxID=376703 RepID=A0AAD4QSM1_9AGAM|nr:methyltransferase-domain-containing protein [Multifurca ochricompacta]
MVLFDVPGWTVPGDPVAVAPKKRKRPIKRHLDKVQSATVNIEKLMGRLTNGTQKASGKKEKVELKETAGDKVSCSAYAIMREDSAVFHDYHKGFRRQVESWPSNPVSHYISDLSSYHRAPSSQTWAAEMLRWPCPHTKGYTVMSFDLVSDRAFVIEADIFERLPLPGSESDGDGSEESNQGHGQIVNVVICALSLMGTNWPNCIREAWRILRPNGELKIAEVASRFTTIQQFQSFVETFGFRHKSTVRTVHTSSRITLSALTCRMIATHISLSSNLIRPGNGTSCWPKVTY